jgi:hypothetical protein
MTSQRAYALRRPAAINRHPARHRVHSTLARSCCRRTPVATPLVQAQDVDLAVVRAARERRAVAPRDVCDGVRVRRDARDERAAARVPHVDRSVARRGKQFARVGAVRELEHRVAVRLELVLQFACMTHPFSRDAVRGSLVVQLS